VISPTTRSARAPGDANGGTGGVVKSWSLSRGLLGVVVWVGGCFGCISKRVERAEYVTRDNFVATCDEIEALLPSAAFYTIDLEMTSLKGPAEMAGLESARPSWADSTEDRYLSMREVVMTNSILSVGVCLFHAPGGGGGVVGGIPGPLLARPYNFLVFPDAVATPNLTLHMQTLVDFHVEECRFDFNKWIYAGVPYTDAAGEAGLYHTMRAQYGLTVFL